MTLHNSPAAAVGARRPRALLWTGIALLTVFVAQGIAVAVNPTQPWTQGLDDTWRGMTGVGPDSDVAFGALSSLFQNIGGLPGLATAMLIVPAILALVGRWRTMLFVIAVQFAGPGLVSQLAKNIVSRPRPTEDPAAGLFGPLVMVDHGSFPSGHAMSMGVIVVTVLALIPPAYRRARAIWIAVSVLLSAGMIWQRTLINAHWLSDALIGVTTGIGVALILWWAFWPWLQRDYGRRPWFLRRTTPAHAAAAH